jgi:hypothetical protein
MSIGRIGAGGGAVERKDRVEVDVQRTRVSRSDLRGAIGRAYQKVTGRSATSAVLDALTAHASLETASGDQMYNYNFGGIKGASPRGETATMRTKEVFDGREVSVRDGFRSYRSLDEGALDYVKLMRGQFGAAVAKAEVGDINGFAHALKQAHYYTADEGQYASALQRLAGQPIGHAQPSLNLPEKPKTHAVASAASFPDTVELDRVLSAIARHPVTVDSRESREPEDDE